MMNVEENQLLAYCFNSIDDPYKLVDYLGADASNNLRSALTLVFAEHAERGELDIGCSLHEWQGAGSFKSVIASGGGYSRKQWVAAFSFGVGFSDTALPLLGILIAIFGGPLTLATLPAALGVAKTLATKLAVLRGPAHRDAISLLNTLAALRERMRRNGESGQPRWSAMLAESGLNEDSAIDALRILRTKSIVTIAEWGAQEEDVKNPDNRWKVKI